MNLLISGIALLCLSVGFFGLILESQLDNVNEMKNERSLMIDRSRAYRIAGEERNKRRAASKRARVYGRTKRKGGKK